MYVRILERGKLGPGERGLDGGWAEGSMPLEQAFKEHGDWIQPVEVAAARKVLAGQEEGEAANKARREAKGVRSMELRGCGLEDMTTRKIAHILRVNTTVTSLGLAWNKVSDEGAAYLGEALRVNSTLVSLDLSNNEVGDQGCERLAEGLVANTTLASLRLDFNNSLLAGGVAALTRLVMLNLGIATLTLSGLGVKAAGASGLANALLHNTSVQRLELNDAFLGPEGGIALARTLAPGANVSLTWLDLASNALGDRGARAIALALRPKAVRPDAPAAEGEDKDKQAAQPLTVLMPTLTSLDMRSNGLGPPSMTELAAALKQNRVLKRLVVSDNKCGDSGAQAIVRALEYNHTLETLLFHDNSIGLEAVEAISVALFRATLKSFDVVFQLANDERHRAGGGAGEAADEPPSLESLTLDMFHLNENRPQPKPPEPKAPEAPKPAAPAKKGKKGKKGAKGKGKKGAKKKR